MSSVFEKTYAYVKRFSSPTASVATTQAVRQCVHCCLVCTPRILVAEMAKRALGTQELGLAEFEVAVLGNLLPTVAEEAKVRIMKSSILSQDFHVLPRRWYHRSTVY